MKKLRIQVVTLFFLSHKLPAIRKQLLRYLIAGIKDQHKWKYKKVVDLLYTFQDVERLMEALWLLHKSGVTYTEADSAGRYGPHALDIHWSAAVENELAFSDYDETDFYTNNLSQAEERNPYLVINVLFESQDLDAVKSKISFWCHTALTNPWEYQAMDKVEMADIYQRVNKIVEAAFVLNEIQLLKNGNKSSILGTPLQVKV
ncbi:hypothetical protein H7F15_05485 [Pontibacter sp. Tf4]|uniref:hypothetical protein n=1 Tax=Pontibacter sp. Tf4 TaxID=2761620 RepID=UPI00162374AE|nr:hypothetical protein [Pontibacter sp. Tf4]MBB6610479.1 hypothetical protein [Pontibacter sp. Tf4]